MDVTESVDAAGDLRMWQRSSSRQTNSATIAPSADAQELDAPVVRSTTSGRRGAQIAAVVPAFNEDRFIGSVVLKTRPFVDHVIVVDDGSSDHTAEIAGEAGARVVSHVFNQGKASALKTGFLVACHMGADVIVALDGDGQHDPAQIPALIGPILAQEADMVIGSRFMAIENQIPVWRQVGQYALTLATNVASGTQSTDSQSGFRAFTRQALETFDIQCDGFAVESEMQFWAHEQALRVAEVPITCVYVEKPKRNPVRQGMQVLDGILSMVSEFRPLLFFGLGGMLLALTGMGCWCWIVQTYQATGQLLVGMALLATLLVAVGTIASFQGITMHLLRKMMQRLTSRLLSLEIDARRFSG